MVSETNLEVYMVQSWVPQAVFKIEAFSWRARSNPRRRSNNIEMKYKTHIKFVRELYDTCLQYDVKI